MHGSVCAVLSQLETHHSGGTLFAKMLLSIYPESAPFQSGQHCRHSHSKIVGGCKRSKSIVCCRLESERSLKCRCRPQRLVRLGSMRRQCSALFTTVVPILLVSNLDC